MAAIPGIPGGGDPEFRSGRRGWLRLDDLVREVVAWLGADGVELSPYVVKVTVQVARRQVDGAEPLLAPALFEAVHAEVRRLGVLLHAAQVERIIRAYASTLVLLDIQDVSEIRM